MKKLLLGILFFAALTLPPSAALAADGKLYLNPQSGVYFLGKPFTVQVYADTGSATVNAVEAELAYSPTLLQVVGISTDGSILGSWSTQPSYDGASGLITFSGWVDKNYTGANGLLITITFKPLKAAQSTLTFNSGAMLQVGSGSNAITSMLSGAYSINPEQVATQAPATTSVQTQTEPQAILPSEVPAASPLPSIGSSSQAAALAYSGIDFAWQYIPFFGILAFIAFVIAYYFHRKRIAF